ncbi:hypothetical protein MHB77_32355 [Paenibacillus sp. FSL K6-3166]|uniref:hypothetical protein n=1 Tax=unclassified Paenibacillus TaxID=185978 RepID=UPI0015C5D907|nr:hypothetical protein [Paenibacillus sp. VTT E-133291]
MSTDDYRAGYEAGYMSGRIDAIKAEPYDDRTPLAKRENTEVSADDRRTLFTAD